jgi:hypothetical protein
LRKIPEQLQLNPTSPPLIPCRTKDLNRARQLLARISQTGRDAVDAGGDRPIDRLRVLPRALAAE